MPDYNDEYTYENIPQRRKNPMSTAALALGILSITCCSVFYVALPFGAIAIICAILSRGKGQMPGKSRAGIICGSVGLIATVIITVSSVYFVLTTENGRNYLQYYYRIYSGDYDFDLDETLEEMFPFLYGSDGGTDSSGQDGSGSSGSDGSDGGGQEYGGFENELPGGGSGDGGSSGSGGSDDGNSGSNNGSDNSSQPDDGGFI